MKVQQERNKLQDAHTQLGDELKGVRAQLSQELQECKAQLEAALSGAGGNTGTSPGNALF